MIHDSAITTYKNPELAPWALGSVLSNFVLNTDPRLADARYPLAHTHAIADVTGLTEALAAASAVTPDPDSAGSSVRGVAGSAIGPVADIMNAFAGGGSPALFGYRSDIDMLSFTVVGGGIVGNVGGVVGGNYLVQDADIGSNQVGLDKLAAPTAGGLLIGSDNPLTTSRFQEIALGDGLTMTGTTLSASADTADLEEDVEELEEATTAEADDFNRLLMWVVETFGQIPPGLENRFEVAAEGT